MTTWEQDATYIRRVLATVVPASDPSTVRVMVHEGAPVAWQRAGGFKGLRRYTPHKLRTAERDLAWCLRTAVPDRPWLMNVALVATFYVHDRVHRDADNLLKTVLDAGNQAGIWHDDSQVTTAMAIVELDMAQPRTVLALCPTTSSLVFPKPPRTAARRPRGVCAASAATSPSATSASGTGIAGRGFPSSTP